MLHSLVSKLVEYNMEKIRGVESMEKIRGVEKMKWVREIEEAIREIR